MSVGDAVGFVVGDAVGFAVGDALGVFGDAVGVWWEMQVGRLIGKL